MFIVGGKSCKSVSKFIPLYKLKALIHHSVFILKIFIEYTYFWPNKALDTGNRHLKLQMSVDIWVVVFLKGSWDKHSPSSNGPYSIMEGTDTNQTLRKINIKLLLWKVP